MKEKKIAGWSGILLLACLILLAAGNKKVSADMVSNPEKGVLWLDDFKVLTIDPAGSRGWRLSDATEADFKTDGEKARLEKGVGTRYFSYDYETVNTPEEYPYLQVMVSDCAPGSVWMIGSGNGMWSTSYVNGAKKGLFTFDFKTFMLHSVMPPWSTEEQKKQGVPPSGTDALNLRNCSGSFVEFDWLKMVSQPKDGVLLKLTDRETTPAVVNVGDTVKIELMLSAPAKEVSVNFEIMPSFNQVEPFSFDGDKTKKMYDDGTNGDLIPGDNVWVAEFPVTKMGSKVKVVRGSILVTAQIVGGKIEKTSTMIPYPVETME
ncbi:MAG: hypothetical protein NTY10_04200 [Candidatus Omnitrophica bacterium]|nr:hypothetical protein [Candidatus Omnitrophota bacterium]